MAIEPVDFLQKAVGLISKIDPDVEYDPAELALLLAELNKAEATIGRLRQSFAERSQKQIDDEVKRFLADRGRSQQQ